MLADAPFPEHLQGADTAPHGLGSQTSTAQAIRFIAFSSLAPSQWKPSALSDT